MKKIYAALLTMGFVLFLYHPAFAQVDQTDPGDTQITTDITVEVDGDTDVEPSGSKFYSRTLLSETLLAGLPTEEPSAENPDEPVGDEVSNNDPGTVVDEPVVVENEDQEIPPDERVAAFVESLSDEQVFALNRSLNNAVNSGLPMVYDMQILEKIVENGYGKKEINAITKAFEQEARFTALAEKTGNEKFLDKALAEKNKFLRKADSTLVTEEVQESAQETVSESVKYSAKQATKNSAQENAMGTAKDMAKDSAKLAAKEAAKNVAKEVAKESAKEAAKNAAKQEAKDVAKQTAKETVKENQKKDNNKGKDKKS